MVQHNSKLTIDEKGYPITESIQGVAIPVDYSFHCVNDFVHSSATHFEELQSLCLGMSNHIESIAKSSGYDKDIARGKHYTGFNIPPSDVGLKVDINYMVENKIVCDFGNSIISTLMTGKEVAVITQGMAGRDLDPFFISHYMLKANPFEFTVLKKAFRMGKGGKSREQDLGDIIGACHKGKIYCKEIAMYTEIEELCIRELGIMDVEAGHGKAKVQQNDIRHDSGC